MAVIERTEWFRRSCGAQGIVLVMVCLTLALANPQGCGEVRSDVQKMGFTPSAVRERPAHGSICGEGSCCDSTLESALLKTSRESLDKYLKESIEKMSSIIDTRARKFDELFQKMMNVSRLEFHDMFSRTYGKIYLQNSEVFFEFFRKLEEYYKKGNIALSDTIESFFGILYLRMFTVINSQYTFTPKYLECVSENMQDLKPFGDVPHKLGVQLRRSFVATRALYSSLSKGANIASKLSHLNMDAECVIELTKMQYCSTCKGMQRKAACSNYCTATLGRCLRHHQEFSPVWDSFVDAVEKVAERLLGPYNIEVVVEPLNIKISEAIMNFQETGADISKKIYEICGTPTLNRTKRKAVYKNTEEDNPNLEIKQEPIKMNGKKKHKKVQKVDNTPSLEKLIAEIKMKVKDTKQFWIHLPFQFCNNNSISAPPSEDGKCWNGSAIATYEKPKHLPDKRESELLKEQVYALQKTIDTLRKSHQGIEVDIVDDSDDAFENSGSGSGDSEDVGEPEGTDDFDINEAIPETSTPRSSTTTQPPEVINVSSARTNNEKSLTRALVEFVLPIVLAWFGGAISDLL